MAFTAASSSMSTKPKPRLWPVSRFLAIEQRWMRPYTSKAFRRSTSVVVNGRFRMNRVFVIESGRRGPLDAESRNGRRSSREVGGRHDSVPAVANATCDGARASFSIGRPGRFLERREPGFRARGGAPRDDPLPGGRVVFPMERPLDDRADRAKLVPTVTS